MRILNRLALKQGARVLDLGGQSEIWSHVATPLDITIVNLPGEPVNLPEASQHRFKAIAGDATSLPQLADNSFDLVFSNSVIEHVGDIDKRSAFAAEVRRLAPVYLVQTPSVWFPIEAHTGIPFWWAFPKKMRRRMIERWKATVPPWAAMVEGTTVIHKRELKTHFPDATLLTERLLGLPKSYVALRRASEALQ